MTREQLEVARKALMSYLWEECGGNHQPTEFYQTIDDHLDKIIAALRSAKDDEPSEAEIEAAAKAMVERAEMSWEHCAQTQWLADARAALIAAARIRGG